MPHKGGKGRTGAMIAALLIWSVPYYITLVPYHVHHHNALLVPYHNASQAQYIRRVCCYASAMCCPVLARLRPDRD
eukprot:2542007-Rhodomonas_salina.1